MKIKILYSIIIVLFISLLLSLSRKETEVYEKTTIDTITSYRTDTITCYKIKYKKKTVIDTLYLPSCDDNYSSFLITQNYYSGDNFEAWVSGYKPSLDSLRVFNNTIINTVNKDVLRTVYKKSTSLYLNAGTIVFDGTFCPNLGVSAVLKNNLQIGGMVGLYKSKPYYGVNLGFKIGKNQLVY